MIKTLFSAIALLLPWVSSAQNQKQTLDSLVFTGIDILGKPNYNSKYVYTYNSQGKVLAETYFFKNHSLAIWDTSYIITYKYDDRGNDTLKVNSVLNHLTKTWDFQNKEIKHYNENNDLLDIIYYRWDVSALTWRIEGKLLHTYNAAHRLVAEENFRIDLNSGIWVPTGKSSHTYSHTSHAKTLETWTGSEWLAYFKLQDEYDVFGYLISNTKLTNKSSNMTPKWEESSKSVYEHNVSGKRISDVFYAPSAATHMLNVTFRNSYQYDQYYNPTLVSYEFWENTSNSYAQHSKIETFFDTAILMENVYRPDTFQLSVGQKNCHHKPLKQISYMMYNNQLVPDGQVDYYYSGNVLTALNDAVNLETVGVFPNPCTDVLHVSGNAQIYDMAGRLVGVGKDRIDVSALEKGIYMVQTKAGSAKVVKE